MFHFLKSDMKTHSALWVQQATFLLIFTQPEPQYSLGLLFSLLSLITGAKNKYHVGAYPCTTPMSFDNFCIDCSPKIHLKT